MDGAAPQSRDVRVIMPCGNCDADYRLTTTILHRSGGELSDRRMTVEASLEAIMPVAMSMSQFTVYTLMARMGNHR
jgi:hypothetical protein